MTALATSGGWEAPISAILFDCFGTLADCGDRQFLNVFRRICEEATLPLAGKDLWDRWLEHGRALARERGRDPGDPLAGPEPQFAPYRDTWLLQFERLFQSLGGSVGCAGDAPGACRAMVDVLARARCFPEVHRVVDALRPHFRLGVLSNADDDFLGACLAENRLDFDLVVSSEMAGCYKPRARIFRHACDALGLPPAQVLYVGDHPVADVLGALSAGLPAVWLNRGSTTFPDRVPAPHAEIGDLGLLPRLLGVSQAAGYAPPARAGRAGRPAAKAGPADVSARESAAQTG